VVPPPEPQAARASKAVIDQIAAEIILRSYLDAGAPEVGPHGPVAPAPES